MIRLVAKVGHAEITLRYDGRTGRVMRSEWPLAWSLPVVGEELESVLVSLLRREPEGSDVAIDVAWIDRAIIARRQRFLKPF